jgi:hypothetical protein
MARATMAALLARLRRIVGDPAGASQKFSDDELQEALDSHRREARYARLREVESIAAGGTVTCKDFEAGVGNWESGAQLTDSGFNVLTTGITEDLLTGRWAFASSPKWPIHVTGWYYDLYGAAAEVLEQWAAKEKLSFDISADGQSFKRSQKAEQLMRLASECRAKAWAGSGALMTTGFNANC